MVIQRKVNCSALVPSELPKYMLQQSALFWKSRTKSIANGNVVYWKLQPASSTSILVCEHRELCKTYFCCLFLRKWKLKKKKKNYRTCLQWKLRDKTVFSGLISFASVFCLFICNCRVFILVWKISKSVYRSREFI